MQSPLSAAERKTGDFPDKQPAHSVNQCREMRVTVGIVVVVVVGGGGGGGVAVAVAVAAVVVVVVIVVAVVAVAVAVVAGGGVVLQVCGEYEGDGLKTSERARRKRRVRSAESKIQSMEEQRLHGFGPLRSETHFVQHGESAVCV